MDGEEPNNRESETETVRREDKLRLATLFSSIKPPSRVQLGLIALGYALVLAHWMFVIHLDNVRIAAHPEEENASGGMCALSEALYDFFHACLLMIATVWLIWLMSKFEAVYKSYSRLLFWLSLTLPVLLAVCPLSPKLFANALAIRLMASPFLLSGMGFSRWPDST